MNELLLLFISAATGFLGSILGLGGGIIFVPVLTLYFKIDIRYAIAASLLSMVVTSSSAAASYLKDHLTNVRVGVFLEIGTVFGAITGYFISAYITPKYLYLLFAGFLLFSLAMMIRKRADSLATKNHPWSEKLKFENYYTNEKGLPISYKVAQAPFALITMYFAGILSALLGIGSGVLKIISMDTAMKLPIKVSSATSNFMIGVTTSASAIAYFARGDIVPEIVAPLVAGIMIGSFLGARMLIGMKAQTLRYIFIILLGVMAIEMIFKGLSL